MKAFYNETYYDRTTTYLSDFSLTLLWSISVSMFPFGGFIGSLMVGVLVNKLGRKGTLLLNNIFSIVPAILMGCSEVAKSFEMIILSRLLVGICAGKRCHTALPFRDLEKPGGGRTGAGMRSHLGPRSTDPSCSSAASRDDARAPTLASRADNGQIFPVLFPGKKAVL